MNVNTEYRHGSPVGQVNEPPQRDMSVLAFALQSVNHRAQITKSTREYKRYNPKRYAVKSKVKQNVRVQEKGVHQQFSAALQNMLVNQQHRMSKDQARTLNSSSLYLPKANGSLIETMRSRLSASPRKFIDNEKLKMPQSAQTAKTKANSIYNDNSYLDMSNMSPNHTLERSFGARTAKKQKKQVGLISEFTSDEKASEIYPNYTEPATSNNESQRIIDSQQTKINELTTELKNQEKLRKENEQLKLQFQQLKNENGSKGSENSLKGVQEGINISSNTQSGSFIYDERIN